MDAPDPVVSSGPGAAGREDARLAALARYAILDTPPEQDFDDLARLAAQLCGTPVGLITFVDDTHQFFKSRIGFDGAADAPLDAGFCPVVVRRGVPLVIPDVVSDPAHAGNPACANGVRFYAGTPLLTPDGKVIGTLCVLDGVPRPQGLSETHLDALAALARQVMSQLELRRETQERRRGEQAFRQLANVVPQIVWAADPEGKLTFFNEQWANYTGFTFDPEQGDGIVARYVHPDDLPHTLAAFGAALRSGQRLELEHRMRAAGGEYRWFLVRAMPTAIR